jgi:TetR/AcrR family transcriptional regulator
MDESTRTVSGLAGDSTEQRIFDAAHEVFMQKGMDGAKMQEIADRAGLNKALLHYYYRTKEKLFEMVARSVINQAVPVVQKTIESDVPLLEKIANFIDFYVDLIRKNPFVPLFIVSELNKHPEQFFEKVMPKELPKPHVFIKQVEDAIERGEIRQIAPQHLIVNVVSMCVFPVLARPMMRMVVGMSPAEMNQFFDERKAEVKRFVFAALRPD